MARLQSLRDKPDTAREYETIYILRPNTPNEGVAEVNSRIKGVIEGMGGKVIKVDNWGKRRLAYEVAKERKGIYLYWQYLATPGVVVMDILVAEEVNVYPMVPAGAGLKDMVLK